MPPQKGQRQARGLARQDQILDAAFELFATKGVRATTIAAVAQQAGLSEAGLLHHFPSKDALLLAVLHRADASLTDLEGWVLAPGGGLASLQRLPATARLLAEQPLLARLRVMVTAESVVEDGAARHYVQERTAAIRAAMAGLLADGVRRGELRADTDVHARAAEIVAFMEGIQIQWLLHPDQIDLAAAYVSYISALADQIAAGDRADR
ncbi:MAG: TetR/AcrR family transcriptional regulator [Acidimicrobiales bacterium]